MLVPDVRFSPTRIGRTQRISAPSQSRLAPNFEVSGRTSRQTSFALLKHRPLCFNRDCANEGIP